MQTSGEQPWIGQMVRDLHSVIPPVRRRQLVLLVALMLVSGLAELAMIGTLARFLAVLSGNRPATGQPGLLLAMALFAGVAVLTSLLRLLLAGKTQEFVFRLGHELGVEIQRRILEQPYSYHIAQNSSRIIASLEKVQILAGSIILQLMQSLAAACISLFILAALLRVDVSATLLAGCGLAFVYVVIGWVTRRRLAQVTDVIGSTYDRRVQLVQESLGGIRDIILDRSQPVHLETFRDIDARLARAQSSLAWTSASPRFLIEAAGIVLLAALALAISGHPGGLMSAAPVLGALALGAQRLLPLLQQLYHGWTVLHGSRAIATDVLQLLQLPATDDPSIRAPSLPFQDEIRLDQVHFRYAGQRQPALCDIRLAIPRGAQIALTGRTGSGKSTLADLLMGLLHPDRGSIMIDKAMLTPDTSAAWQRNIAHVPQSIFLADTSIARNIAFGIAADEVDMVQVRKAAAAAHLDEFIGSLDAGYETLVGERGIRLSGGQRQRLGIARALYKQAPVLILDEATSALDLETEAAVMESIRQLDGGRTIIVIAHRPSTIEWCDRIVRLECGRIAEIIDRSATGQDVGPILRRLP